MRWVKANSESVKRQNRRMLLDVLRAHQAISRADISKITSLNKVTVSALVDELVQERIVREIGNGESSVGRKPILLEISPTSGFLLGAEIVPDYGQLICMDLSNNITKVRRFSLHAGSLSRLLSTFREELYDFIGRLPDSEYGVLAMGLAIRGVVDTDCSTVIKFSGLDIMNQLDLGSMLSEEFDFPVIVDNRANAAAWGEHLLGVGQDRKSLIYLMLGRHGIGAGYVLNHQLYRGTTGFAGEITCMPINMSGPLCRCGNRGCWGTYVDEVGVQEACLNFNVSVNSEDIETSGTIVPWLARQAESGDVGARRVFEYIGEYLGVGFTSLISAFNPDMIVIGGRMSAAYQWVLPSTRRTLESRCHPQQLRDLRISVPSNADMAVARGAAALVLDPSLDRLADGTLKHR